jgi:hypothetical protein
MARAWVARALRDWRVKATVPIVAIHVVAIAGLSGALRDSIRRPMREATSPRGI